MKTMGAMIPSMCKSPPTQSGFTLLEVIIALSIFTIGILAVASMQISAIKGNAAAGGYTESTIWAGDQIERLMHLPYDHDDLQDTDGDGIEGLDDATDAEDDNPNQTPVHGKYRVYWNVAVDDVAHNTKTVSVIVTWPSSGGQKRVSMRHIIPNI